jgi:hypothetical protein
MANVVERQEAIDNLLLPYRKMSMAVKVARWELERLARPAAPSTVDTRNGARSGR